APAIISGTHRPTKMFESEGGVVFDNFLPDDVYQRLYEWAQMADYEYINTHGKVTRAWHVHDGFPLRSTKNVFYHVENKEPQKPEHVYPVKNDVDKFVEAILEIQPQVEPWVGKKGEQWAHFSVTSWLYPHGTGLAMHDDGSGVYTGAYTFFMNPTWRAHWGGLLVLMDEEANKRVHQFRQENDQFQFYKKKFLHAGALDDLLLEQGMGKVIFPKGNRIVFIANDAYHMITRVNEQAGDILRMSFAGFFNRKK
ncbi:MAG: 2OG-Fe(II) oxygenase, partial [Rickettsiales bacterium]|nr:2OG-Fe(II) oxygenase [Rickettsiales bacterium]